MRVYILAMIFIGFFLNAEAREIPGHRSLAFATAGGVLPSMSQFCGAGGPCIEEPVRVGGWNMQRLGIAKMNKPDVVHNIVKVIHNYDLIVLQEVTDSSETTLPRLLVEINENLTLSERYDVVISPRNGRTSYKEQYALFYKTGRMQFVKSYLYNDTSDAFQFEPYVVHFNSTAMGDLTDFVVIPLHAKPADAPQEIDALVDVYEDMVEKWGIEDSILIGDFNAGCSYVTQSEYGDIRLYNDTRFHWLISDHADTTTKTTSCPYDRIVVIGDVIKKQTYYKTATVYFFDEALGIESNWELVSDISDHYPVGVMIRGSVPAETEKQEAQVAFSVDLYPECWAAIYGFLDGIKMDNPCDDNSTDVDDSTVNLPTIAMAEWTVAGLDEAAAFLIRTAGENPEIISEEATAVLGYKLGHGILQDRTLYAPTYEPPTVSITFLCRNDVPKCTLSLSAASGVN